MDRLTESDAADGLTSRTRVFDALASGVYPDRAAEVAGMGPKAVRAGLADDPEFIAALNRTRREQADWLRAEVRSLATEAVSALRNLISGPDVPPAVRLRASLAILGAAGAMSEETIGPTTAEAVRAEQTRRGLLGSLGL